MPKYEVKITETTTVHRTEEIEAADIDEAWEKAQDEFELKDTRGEGFEIEVQDVEEIED